MAFIEIVISISLGKQFNDRDDNILIAVFVGIFLVGVSSIGGFVHIGLFGADFGIIRCYLMFATILETGLYVFGIIYALICYPELYSYKMGIAIVLGGSKVFIKGVAICYINCS